MTLTLMSYLFIGGGSPLTYLAALVVIILFGKKCFQGQGQGRITEVPGSKRDNGDDIITETEIEEPETQEFGIEEVEIEEQKNQDSGDRLKGTREKFSVLLKNHGHFLVVRNARI